VVHFLVSVTLTPRIWVSPLKLINYTLFSFKKYLRTVVHKYANKKGVNKIATLWDSSSMKAQQIAGTNAMPRTTFYTLVGKRFFDITLASIIMLFVLPIMGLALAAVWLTMGRPLFFKQIRAGLDEKSFGILKIRTMSNEKDISGALLKDEKRNTPIGTLIRRLSIDELPQLLNVIKGDMSLIGPRPLYPSYLPYYNSREKARHSVRPGMTGLAQINGRNSTTWEKRLELDASYVENVSFSLDCSILFKTALKVLKSNDVESGAIPTMRLLSEERKNAI
jgi:lipopolysaccharide/colanic/teichoic acid biosynthesis glycosyltransferase